MIHIQNSVYHRKFRHIHVLLRHIQPYCAIFRTLCSSWIFRTLPIQNPGIFITSDTFWTLSRHILAYSERCVTFAYWEPCHIQNFTTFRILVYLGTDVYSESCSYKRIQAYPGIFDNDSYNSINFRSFFHCNLTDFSMKWRQWRQF